MDYNPWKSQILKYAYLFAIRLKDETWQKSWVLTDENFEFRGVHLINLHLVETNKNGQNSRDKPLVNREF